MNVTPAIPTLFRASASRTPMAPAILTEPVWSYAELDRTSDAIAAGLAAHGLKPGDRVGLYCPNGAEFVLCYLGILKAGAVVVPINLLLHPDAVSFILNDCGVAALCVHTALVDNARRACFDSGAAAPTVGLWVLVGPDAAVQSGAESPAEVSLEALMQGAGAGAAPLALAPDQNAVILYTSGTTGRPKGAVLTHANLVSNARAVAQVLGFQAGQERVLVVLPMFHAFAGTVGILTPLLSGGRGDSGATLRPGPDHGRSRRLAGERVPGGAEPLCGPVAAGRRAGPTLGQRPAGNLRRRGHAAGGEGGFRAPLRHRDPGGRRPHRVRSGHLRQPARGTEQAQFRRPPDPRGGDAHRPPGRDLV